MFTDTDYKRIYWHSRRGMLELDLVLVPFVENRLRQLAPDDQALYVQLLESEDTDLFRWFLRAERPDDPELARIVALILAATGAGGGSAA